MTGALLRLGGMDDLARGLAELGDFLDQSDAGPRCRFQAELVFEEIVTNALRHGYDGDADRSVDVSVSVSGGDVVLVVSDGGRPFNPLEQADPEQAASLSEARIGGLGIMLARKAARAISYERSGGRNVLTVTIARD